MTPARILVIEDDPDLTAVLRDMLEAEGYRVMTAAAPLDPIDVSQLRPRLIVLDLWFGHEARGWDQLKALRSTPGARDIPVLVCTADATVVPDALDRLGALEADVILKPFDLDEFLGRVAVTCGPGSGFASPQYHATAG